MPSIQPIEKREKFPVWEYIAFVVVAICIALAIFALAQSNKKEPEPVDNSLTIEHQEVYNFDPCGLDTVICPHEKTEAQTIQDKIEAAATEAGISPVVALRIAACESSLRPHAQNPLSSAGGLYQFTAPTWEYIGNPGDRFNADDAISAFVEWYPKYPHWWECK